MTTSPDVHRQEPRANPAAPFPWAGVKLRRFPKDRSFIVSEHNGKVQLRMDVLLKLHKLGRIYEIDPPIPDALGPLPRELVVCMALNETRREQSQGLVTWLPTRSMRRGLGYIVHGPQLLYTHFKWRKQQRDRYDKMPQLERLRSASACNVYSWILPETANVLPLWTYVASEGSQGKHPESKAWV